MPFNLGKQRGLRERILSIDTVRAHNLTRYIHSNSGWINKYIQESLGLGLEEKEKEQQEMSRTYLGPGKRKLVLAQSGY